MEDIPKKNQPLVSVGICTYNRPKGLRKTLECITRQTYTNLEIIVSQDFHKDLNFQSIIDEFNDFRISFYHQDAQLFMNNNFNFVLSKSNGAYFMWAADDDLWEPDFIEEGLKKFTDDSILLVTPKSNIINAENEFIFDWDDGSKYLDNVFTNISSFVNKAFRYNLGFYGIYKTTVLREIPLLNCYGNDQLLIANILAKGKIELTDKLVFHYRNNGFSFSRESYLKSMGLTAGFSYKYPFIKYLFEYLKITSKSSLNLYYKFKLSFIILNRLRQNSNFRIGLKQDLKY